MLKVVLKLFLYKLLELDAFPILISLNFTFYKFILKMFYAHWNFWLASSQIS